MAITRPQVAISARISHTPIARPFSDHSRPPLLHEKLFDSKNLRIPKTRDAFIHTSEFNRITKHGRSEVGHPVRIERYDGRMVCVYVILHFILCAFKRAANVLYKYLRDMNTNTGRVKISIPFHSPAPAESHSVACKYVRPKLCDMRSACTTRAVKKENRKWASIKRIPNEPI